MKRCMRMLGFLICALSLVVPHECWAAVETKKAAKEKTVAVTKKTQNQSKKSPKSQKKTNQKKSAPANKKSAKPKKIPAVNLEHAKSMVRMIDHCHESQDTEGARRLLHAMSALGNTAGIRLERARASVSLMSCLMISNKNADEVQSVFDGMRQYGNSAQVLRQRSIASVYLITAYAADQTISDERREKKAQDVFGAMSKFGNTESHRFDQAEASVLLIEIHMSNKAYQEAHGVLDDLFWLAQSDQRFQAYETRALTTLTMGYAQSGAIEEAAPFFERLQKSQGEPEEKEEIAWATCFMADAYQRTGRLEEAEKTLSLMDLSHENQALKIMQAEVLIKLVLSYQKARQPDKAKRVFARMPEAGDDAFLRQIIEEARITLDE